MEPPTISAALFPAFYTGGAIGLIVAVMLLCVVAGCIFLALRRHTELSSELQRVSNSLYLAEKMGGVGTWVLNVANQSVRWSDQVFIIHRRDPGLGEPPLESSINYYHPADRERVGALVECAIDRGESFEFKARLVAEDGTIKIVVSRGMCRTNDAGKVVQVYGIFIEQSHVIDVDRFDNDNVPMAA
ncbi:MAG: PAS domain-containing protein [Pontixanthobacter sp.]